MRTAIWHYGLMGALAFRRTAFEAVGAILAVVMLIVPPMFAAQLSDRLPWRLGLTVIHAVISALLGLHISVWLNCSAAGVMVVAVALLFVMVWMASLVWRWSHVRRISPESPIGQVPAVDAST
jgi:manganese/zinc/iron transport system permease protein